MKRLYLKKLSNISGFAVWIVNGKYIRDKIDIEFTNYGQNYQFSFIPKDELWIDKSRVKGEEKYYIKTMLSMNKLMSSGVSHEDTHKIVDQLEKKERIKDLIKKKKLESEDDLDKTVNSVYVKQLVKYSNENVKVWIVDGNLVRAFFFTDFTEGGNDMVYSFIPKNEIWIDNSLSTKEIKFILLHELHERRLMRGGMIYDYMLWEKREEETAHKYASKMEKYYREYPWKINKALKEELEKVSLVRTDEVSQNQNTRIARSIKVRNVCN